MTPIVVSQLFAIALALAPAAAPAAGASTASTDARVDAGPPDLVVSPAVIEWQLPGRGRSQVRVRVGNAGTDTVHLRAGLGSWSLDEAGTATPLPADPHGLSGLLRVYPESMALAAGEQRSLRLWLPAGAGLGPGEHRALLRLRSGRDAAADRDRFDLAIYAWRGPVLARPRLEAMTWHLCGQQLQWRARAGNDGSRHARLDGWLVVAAADGSAQRHALPRTPVLPGASLRLALGLPWSAPAPARVFLEGRFGPLELTGLAVVDAGEGACAH